MARHMRTPRHHSQSRQIPLRQRGRRICWLRDWKQHRETMQKVREIHRRLPHPEKSHGCPLMVRPDQSGIIRIQHDGHHAPIQEPSQTKQHLLLG